jgi:ribose transport system substrate-binding protein
LTLIDINSVDCKLYFQGSGWKSAYDDEASSDINKHSIEMTMMNLKNSNYLLAMALAVGLIGPTLAQENPALFMTRASAKIANEMGFKNKWDGPTTGPKIGEKKLVVFIASDLRNTSVAALAKAAKEAAAVAGWDLFTIDCWGLATKHAEAFSRALALKPGGIILASIDARGQAKEISAATAKKIPVVGWHAATKIGPSDGLFTNLGTDPKEVGQTAALLSVVESNGKEGVVVFTDPSNLYSVVKSNEIVDVIKRCQTCSLLGLEELPVTSAPEQMPAILTALVKRHGKKWTHVISVHDIYFDLMTTPAATTILADLKLQALSAGDGSESAYRRIRTKTLQMGTVPEPIAMQGWQLIDELNRSFAGEKPSGFSTAVYAVTIQNIAFHGGPKNEFEPENGYRNEYRKIWGK